MEHFKLWHFVGLVWLIFHIFLIGMLCGDLGKLQPEYTVGFDHLLTLGCWSGFNLTVGILMGKGE